MYYCGKIHGGLKASVTDSLMDFLKTSMISLMSENSSIVRVGFVSSVLIPSSLSSSCLGGEGGGWQHSVSANLKVVHIGPKHFHIGHILVQTTAKMG